MPESFDEAFPGGFEECVSTLGQEPSIDDPEALCGWLQEHGFDAIAEASPDSILAGLEVEFVSVVDQPAQDSEWLLAKSDGADPADFQPGGDDRIREAGVLLKDGPADTDDPDRKVWAAVLKPGEADAHGDLVPEPEIEAAAHTYLKEFRKVDSDHDLLDGEGEPIESYIVRDGSDEFETPDGTTKSYPEGTWIMGVELSDEAWKRVEDGDLTGFSIYGGAAKLNPDALLTEEQAAKIASILAKQDYSVGDRIMWEFSTGTSGGRVDEIEDTPGNEVSVGEDGNKSGNDIVRVAEEDNPAYLVEVWREESEEFDGYAAKKESELSAWTSPPEEAAKGTTTQKQVPDAFLDAFNAYFEDHGGSPGEVSLADFLMWAMDDGESVEVGGETVEAGGDTEEPTTGENDTDGDEDDDSDEEDVEAQARKTLEVAKNMGDENDPDDGDVTELLGEIRDTVKSTNEQVETHSERLDELRDDLDETRKEVGLVEGEESETEEGEASGEGGDPGGDGGAESGEAEKSDYVTGDDLEAFGESLASNLADELSKGENGGEDSEESEEVVRKGDTGPTEEEQVEKNSGDGGASVDLSNEGITDAGKVN